MAAGRICISNDSYDMEYLLVYIILQFWHMPYFRTCRFEKQTLMHLWRIWKIFSFNFQEVRWVFVYAKKRVLANIYFKSGKESNAIRIQATLNSGISVSVIYLPENTRTSGLHMFQTKSVFKLYAYVPDQMRILLLSDHMRMAINKLIILKHRYLCNRRVIS
jgi:hypothetical protein